MQRHEHASMHIKVSDPRVPAAGPAAAGVDGTKSNCSAWDKDVGSRSNSSVSSYDSDGATEEASCNVVFHTGTAGRRTAMTPAAVQENKTRRHRSKKDTRTGRARPVAVASATAAAQAPVTEQRYSLR